MMANRAEKCIFFNELSMGCIVEDRYEAEEYYRQFASALAEARKLGIKWVRTSCDASSVSFIGCDYSLYSWLFDKSAGGGNRKYRDFLQAMLRLPFIDEADSDIEDKWLHAGYRYYGDSKEAEGQECLGLAAAALYGSLSVSLAASETWRAEQILIRRTDIDGIKDGPTDPGSTDSAPHITAVFNAYSPESIYSEAIRSRIEQVVGLELAESGIEPDDKPIHLADHHGKDALARLWHRLRSCPYVVSARSTGWGGGSFIRTVREDLSIDVVDLKHDERYALNVQTTARTRLEAYRIADSLVELAS